MINVLKNIQNQVVCTAEFCMYRVNILENIENIGKFENRNDIATTIVFQKVAIFGVQSKVH